MTIDPSGVGENATDRNRRGEPRKPAVGKRDVYALFGGEDTMNRIVIIGGGPAGYEAALVAAQLGAEVTVIESDGAGGACVLSDRVPSKTFIASSDVGTAFHRGASLGVRLSSPDAVGLDGAAVHARVKR